MGEGLQYVADDLGAPAQPPWLQGYQYPLNGARQPLLQHDELDEQWVRTADERSHDVADQAGEDPRRYLHRRAGDSDWVVEQHDPLDPVEARAAELARLLERGDPAAPSHTRDEPGRHRASPGSVEREQRNGSSLGPPPIPAAASAPPPRAPRPVRRDPVRPLEEAAVANPGRFAPQSGWRRAIYRASVGKLNPGDSAKDRRRDELFTRIRQPIRGDFRIAVLSIKGGVGKTTTTLGLGSAFATIRTDRVIAVDANPDRGTLAQRVNDPSEATVHDLLSDPNITRYSDVRYYTRMSDSRLEVLGSPLDPAISEAFGEADYRRTIDILQSYYNVILTDCGTGIMHSAMTGVLDLAHAIVVVSSPALDAARSASATLDWLMNHGYAGLVRESHLVLSAARPGETAVRMDKVYQHFESRCRSVHLIPFDSHLAEGAEVDMELLKPATVQAYIELAGAVADKFARLRPNG